MAQMTTSPSEFADLPPTLKAERHGAVAVLRLNRAAKRNALDDQMVHGIGAFFAALPDDVRAVVLAGEGEPDQVMTARGLAVVRDDSLIQAAVDEALAANPDVAEKIRGGKVQAAGAIVGAVMKATKGQADAARVRELVLKACS